MFLRLGSLLLLLAACSSSETSTSSSSSASSASSSSGGGKDAAVDPDAKVTATECKDRCRARLTGDECARKSADADKACNALCLERGTNAQMACVDEAACDDLTHDTSLATLCPI